MDIDLAEIEQSLVMVYQKNLQFLKENFFDIFEEVDQFSNDLEAGKIKEKYSLEMKNGYFDIQNLEDGGYYYATNSYIDASGRSLNSDFSLNSSLNLLRQNSQSTKLISNKEFKDVLPIVDYINENVDLNSVEFREIFKMVFIGTGLGLHIQEIYRKLDPKIVLIIEPNIEIFRLSLFTTDYTMFVGTNRSLFLNVGDSKVNRFIAYDKFYQCQDYMNFNIKYHSILENYKYIHDEIKDYFSSNSSSHFPYKLTLDNLHKTVLNIKNNERFLDINLISQKNIFKDKKVLLISAGPSVDNYIDFIREYQNKFIIACVDVIARKLEKNSIKPDIIFSIDPSPRCAKYLTMEDPTFLDNSTIIFMSQQHENTLTAVKNQNTYFSQSLPIIEEIGYLGTVSNVGAFSFTSTTLLGAKEIYIVGNDAAFNQETGNRYSSDSSYSKMDSLDNSDNDTNTILRADILEVKGNLRETVKTNRELYAFKDDFERFLHDMSRLKDVTIYNLSDGVYIEGMIPLRKDGLIKNMRDTRIHTKNFKNEMDSISRNIGNINFDEDIKVINSILGKVSKFKKNKFKNRDEFLSNKLDLMVWIIEYSKNHANPLIPNLFLIFTSLADLYINFILNLQQKDLHTKEKINTISKMWTDGLYNLFKDIKKSLSN